MYVFQPGSGFSGPSIKVEPGFEMNECTQDHLFYDGLSYETCDESQGACASTSNLLQLSECPDSQIMISSKSKRYVELIYIIFHYLVLDINELSHFDINKSYNF